MSDEIRPKEPARNGLAEELARTRATLQTFIEEAPFGVHRYRLAPDGALVLVSANEEADRVLGIRHADLIGKTIEKAFPNLSDTRIPTEYRRVARSGGVYFDEQLSYSDARISGAYEVHAFQPGPMEVAVLFRDVTERWKAERELHERTEELDRYFSLGLDLFCIMDCDGVFRRLNPAWETTFGIPLKEMLGMSMYELVDGDDHDVARGAMRSLGGGRQVSSFSTRCRRRDGTSIWLEWRVSMHEPLVYAAARDMTERVEMQRLIVEREERLTSIFRAAPVGIGMASNRVVMEANARLVEITGYSHDELVGISTRRFYDSDEEYQRVGQELGTAEAVSGSGFVETHWIRKDGSSVDILMGTAPIVPDAHEAGVTFTVLDVTERRRAARERQTLETRMLQTQKLESLGVLAGGIAHDFNNILMAVLGHADLAQAQMVPGSPAQENILEIEKAARRAADLCRQMLAYSGKGRFVIQSLDLNEVIQDMEPMLAVSISKRVALRNNLAPQLPAIEADITQLRQVIMNLVINASEAIGEANGVITLSTGESECDRSYLRTACLDEDLPEGRYIFVEVSDNGRGMDTDTQKKIFEPFFSTKFTGRGLGLAAVLGIVRGHRGTIKVYSEIGKGTTIKVMIPVSAEPVSHISAPTARAARWKGSGTVLLADDEESVRIVAKQMLERLGFSVLLANDGREALAVFDKNRAVVKCVIMDLTMPQMDGEEAFREIRLIDPTIRVLLSSGYNEQEAVQRFVGKGLAGFLQKPYQLSLLEQKLREVLTVT